MEDHYRYEVLDKFTNLFKKFQEQDMDILVPITGIKGCGKSTLALQLARKYLFKFWDWQKENADFDIWFKNHLEDFVAYDNFDLMNKIEKSRDSQPIVCDEAVRFAMSEDWMKAESKELKKMFTQIRNKHLIIIFCIPEFWWIDRKYREDMTLFWIHILERGTGIIFTSDLRIGIKDKWHRKKFDQIVKKPINIFTPVREYISTYSKHPCYWDVIHWGALPAGIYQKYLQLRVERVSIPNLRVKPNWPLRLALWKLYRGKFKLNGEKMTFRKLVELFAHPITNELPFRTIDTGRKFVEQQVKEVDRAIEQFKKDKEIPNSTNIKHNLITIK